MTEQSVHDDTDGSKTQSDRTSQTEKRAPEDRSTPGGQPMEDVEDRSNVGIVSPEDYPAGLPDH